MRTNKSLCQSSTIQNQKIKIHCTLYINHEENENEIKKGMPFIIVCEIMKCLGQN
jgi:hypothetical protein